MVSLVDLAHIVEDRITQRQVLGPRLYLRLGEEGIVEPGQRSLTDAGESGHSEVVSQHYHFRKVFILIGKLLRITSARC